MNGCGGAAVIITDIKCKVGVMSLNHPETSHPPCPWKICLPQNPFLVPKSLGPKRGTQKNACYNGTSRGGWERTEDKSQDKCKEKKSLKYINQKNVRVSFSIIGSKDLQIDIPVSIFRVNHITSVK